MKGKIRVALLFGGKSAEHEVSIQSAKNVYAALDKKKYEIIPIAISKSGKWIAGKSLHTLLTHQSTSTIPLDDAGKEVLLLPQTSGQLVDLHEHTKRATIDVVFPMLHGTYGEDGSIQGLLKLAGVPFVGAGVLGSAVGMDKDVMKRLLKEAGLPVTKFISIHFHERLSFREVKKKLGLPIFVKPANLGSSVGVSKVHNEKEFRAAVSKALQYDTKILCEKAVIGREVECAVLGNEKPIASVVGEVVPSHDFYSYEAKYLDENGAALEIPVELAKSKTKEIRELAVKTFKVLECEGMGRVDFFLTKRGKVLVNEINTIPGFTAISMYPKLWKASSISYAELVDRLIQLAIERFQREQKLQTSYGG